MLTKFYSLPEWDLVGGETQSRMFTLYHVDGGPTYNIPGATVELAVADFVNPTGVLKLAKSCKLRVGDDGNYCDVLVALDPIDTLNLQGKYIYQITIKDDLGNIAAPRGIMRVMNNINKSFAL